MKECNTVFGKQLVLISGLSFSMTDGYLEITDSNKVSSNSMPFLLDIIIYYVARIVIEE